MVGKWGRPTLYNLTSELIWPEVITRARSHPEEVTWRDNNGGTALHHSCRFQHSVDVVKEMLKSRHSAAGIQDKLGSTPLHIACWNGSVEIVRVLVEAHQAAANTPDNSGRTPLHVACASCPPPTVDTIQLLLKAGPGVIAMEDTSGNTPLSLLCERHEVRLRLAMDSVDRGLASDDIYESVLQPFWTQLRLLLEANVGTRFAAVDDWRLVHALTSIPNCPRLLFELALKLHPEQVKESVYGSLPLHLAAECPASVVDCEHDDGFYVCTLLSLFPWASQIADSVGRLPLHIAIESGKSWDAVIRKLFQAFPPAIMRRDGKNYLLPAMIAALPIPAVDVGSSRRMRTSPILVDKFQQLTTLYELFLVDPSCVKLSYC